MKKVTFLLNISLVITMLILGSCNYEEDSFEDNITQNEKKLNLQSPSGEYIAETINTLKEKLAPIIEQGHSESKDFEITNIQYESLTAGFTAEIEYKTKDGIESNIIITKVGSTSVPGVKTRSEGDSEVETTYYKCKSSSNNRCKKCRVINDTKHHQVRCACDSYDGIVEGCELYEYKY